MRKRKILVNIMLGFLLLNITVMANGGPGQPTFYDPDGGLHYSEDSTVKLVAETINVVINKDDYQKANVNVEYKMKNQGDEISLDMYFALPMVGEYEDIEKDYSVFINSVDVTKQCEYDLLPDVDNWMPNYETQLTDPITKDVIYESRSYQGITSYGIMIPITMNQEEEVDLQISYEGLSGIYDNRRNPLYSFIYFMTPAKFWLGEPEVNYQIEFPSEGKFEIVSNLNLKETESDYYEGALNELPKEEWVVTYASRSGLFFGQNDLDVHNSIIWILVLIVAIASFVLRIKYKKAYITILSYVLAVILILFLTGPTKGGYAEGIIMFIKIIFFVVIIPIIYLVFQLIRLAIKSASKKGIKDK